MSIAVDVSPFERALTEFRSSLGPQEQSIFTQCKSAKELMDHVESLEILKSTRKRGSLVYRLSRFSNSLRHYFDVIGIIVQSHPEYAALAWGAFRLVLQLASNFDEFFDKLTKTLSRISEVLPSYEDLTSSLQETKRGTILPHKASSQLVASLTKIYVDLFAFLQSVVRVFTKKDNTNKSKVVIVNSLFWKPYDSRFEDILETMQHHRELLTTELSLYAHQSTHMRIAREHEMLENELQGISDASSRQQGRVEEIRDRIEGLATTLEKVEGDIGGIESNLAEVSMNIAAQVEVLAQGIDETLRSHIKASLSDRVRTWLSAPEYARDLGIARACREEGTSRWFFRQQIFQQWLHRIGQDVAKSPISQGYTIWIKGNPGFGKTILAGAAIDELETRMAVASRTLYFFFRREPTLDNSIAAYRSLLTQIFICYDRDEIFDKFAFAMKYSPTSQSTGTRTELLELLRLCTALIGPHYIVLDGVDECCDNEALVHDLKRLSSGSKLILFSRPNVRLLPDLVDSRNQFDIGRSNATDIQVYLQRKLESLSDRHMIPEHSSVQVYTDHLTKGADGMFLWARLMTDYLDSEALSDQDRHDTIMAVSMPERLSMMYMRIIRLITQGYLPNRKLAKWIIMWLTFSKRQLSAAELEESVKILNENKRVKPHRWDFNKAVVMICASLVERATLWDSASCKEFCYFRFIHSTVKEYFLELASGESIFELSEEDRKDVARITTSEPHAEIGCACLRYLLYYMPAQSLNEASGYPTEAAISKTQFESAFPFGAYSVTLWIDHIQESKDKYVTSNGPISTCSSSLRSLLDLLDKFLNQKKVVKVWVEATYVLDFDHSAKIDILRTWHRKFDANTTYNRDYSVKIGYVVDAVGALISYISELDKYWGTLLKACPGRLWVWDEINAFTHSQFSEHSSATIHSLVAGNPLHAVSTLSSQYLCKVSASTPDMVGTLSIWTSRTFESCYMRGFLFYEVLRDECTEGWMARYETWSLGKSPKRLSIKDIFLKKAEIRLHFLQSLHRRSKWAIQFPLAISSDLQRLAILRTVYWLESEEARSEHVLRSAVLDLNLDLYSSRMWNGLHYSDMQGEREGRSALYVYWIRFGRCGKEVFFLDQRNVAIFSLRPSAHGEPSLTAVCIEAHNYCDASHDNLSWMESYGIHAEDEVYDDSGESLWTIFYDREQEQRHSRYGDSEPMRQLDVQFHPSKPLVAYRTGRHVFLWAFKNTQSRAMLCYEMQHASASYPEHITFTSNGEQLIIKENNSELPIILPLPEQIVHALAQSAVCPDYDNSGEVLKDTQPKVGSTLDLWGFGNSSREFITGAQVQTLATGDSLGLNTIASTSSASVLLWKDTAKGFEQQKLEIINFPAWEGIESVTTSVKLPEPGESAVTLVLNKAVQPENSFGTAQIERFPAVITREVASLRPRPVDNTEEQRKRLQEGLDEHREKRRRLTEKAEGHDAD